ncbi:MAG: hypothetical protein K0S32_3529 [Bacteroidetes bacterium]|jgi:prenyltransferase beta subunit|nr:hypothetical protein [Bacteroidota bacterium]
MLFSFTAFSQDKIQINSSIEKGISFLKKIQCADGAICDTSNSLFDVWETISAAEALYSVNKDTNEICFKKAMSFLRTNENEKGLICHNKKCKEAYCLETTAAYFLLLLQTGQKEKVMKCIPFILDLQKNTGEWEIGNPDVREQKSFPSVTAFMVWLLNEVKLKPKYEKEVVLFVRKTQNDTGHWGAAWEYYNIPAYALWPMMHLNRTETKKQLKSTNKYIRKSQEKDGSWDHHKKDNQPSASLQTALMLDALMTYSSEENTKAIEKGLSFLLKEQNSSGNWDGGQFPIDSKSYLKKEYVFATARSIIILNRYLQIKQK